MWLWILLCLESVLRLCIEIRECRIMQNTGIVKWRKPISILFALFRLIPLINDIIPLPESAAKLSESDFIKEHELAHKQMHHGILRNILKIIFLMLAVWCLVFLLSRCGFTILIALLWLHLLSISFRIFFHHYCWNQEYDADLCAFKAVGKSKAKDAMRELLEKEQPFTQLFALLYREHPTAKARHQKLFK